MQGGVGRIVGALTGGLIIAVINSGMSLIGSPSERVQLVKGLVLLAAVAFDIWTKRRAASGKGSKGDKAAPPSSYLGVPVPAEMFSGAEPGKPAPTTTGSAVTTPT